MYKRLLLLALLYPYTVTAQDTIFDPFSIELRVGLNNPVNPMAPTYDAQSLGLFHGAMDFRYMLNTKFGVNLETAFDQLKSGRESTSFTTNYFRATAGINLNLGNVFHFYDWTDRFGLLMSAGAGFSSMKEVSSNEPYDQMMNITFGLIPQWRLSNRWVIDLSMVSIAHIYQSRTYDFSQTNNKRGVDGYLFNLSVGLRYNFGKGVHADWLKTMDLDKALSDLDHRISALEEAKKDDDGDGVANYLDLEPASAQGAVVNTKGQTQHPELKDSDLDGVPDAADTCPFQKGAATASGCPDADADGIADKSDECPLLAGTLQHKGCPEIAEEMTRLVQQSRTELIFPSAGAVLGTPSAALLDAIALQLAAHPEYHLFIACHTGTEGDNLKNLELSQRRADAIRNYLLQKGIATDRLTALGFGETQPVPDATGVVPAQRTVLEVRFK